MGASELAVLDVEETEEERDRDVGVAITLSIARVI